MKFIKLTLLLFMLSLVSCASTGPQPPCGPGYLELENCPPDFAINDTLVNQLYDKRLWREYSEIGRNPIELGIHADIPLQQGQVKLLGSSHDDAVRSIATKIWLIENAKYSIDATYYIFSRDLVGRAMLGALCNAVKRGVDVRLMVDSIGSYHSNHSELKALNNCTANAGFLRNQKGKLTTKKARAQVVIFNALSKVFVRFNRRSHDKLLVIDGSFPKYSRVVTGGRNISLDYYGITKTGEVDRDVFKDTEIIIKSSDALESTETSTVGELAELYFSALFLHKGNKKLEPWFAYAFEAEDAQKALKKLKSFEIFREKYNSTHEFLSTNFSKARVKLAHELDNLENTDVVEGFEKNRDGNPNSIVKVLRKMTKEAKGIKTLRIVSPYLFLPEYTDASGNVIYDAKVEIGKWLAEDPERSVEVLTNSVLTSDNFMAQAVIDMDMAPRLLLDDAMEKAWLGDEADGEFNPDVVESDKWKTLTQNSRIKIYQLGRVDSTLLGGESYYGKLHAKFIVSESLGFVGTTNLDYRSRLYNNELGYFFESEELQNKLIDNFELLKSQSYLWGSEDWLNMRKKVREIDGWKGRWAKKQRTTFTRLRLTGLKWLL